MPRSINRLTAARVRSIKDPGTYGDGNGLYLQVRNNSKSWIFRFMRHGRPRTMGLGSIAEISLAKAREKALAARGLLRDSIDPIQHRAAKRRLAETPIFRDAAATYIETHKGTWRNNKHAKQWENTLATYAEPKIGNMSVKDITTEDVLTVLQPIWNEKPETASRVRGRIERIMDWAASRGYREGLNPARWAGHLEFSLPSPRRVRRPKHHPALEWSALQPFWGQLSEQQGLAPRALMLTILVAARTQEVRGARWDEFDLMADIPLWIVPGDRMKSGREHRVPLAKPVIELLDDLPRFSSGFLFEGRPGKPLSENAMLAVLKRMDRSDITVHGFRSTFRDWCAEQTAFPREIAEVALAHVNKDRVEAAYLRSDLLRRRYRLMQRWARYATTMSGRTIVELPIASQN